MSEKIKNTVFLKSAELWFNSNSNSNLAKPNIIYEKKINKFFKS